jgi:Sulfatase
VPEASRRDVLPIPDRAYAGLVTYDAKDPATSFPPIEPLRPPAGAPNVLVVLLDDVGFGASSAFGGPCQTPTAERLAAGGLKYTRFHTTALCSPTRQALLTGRNHHAVGMGGITEIATSAPGYSSIRPNSAAPLAEVLKLNGYSTAQFGKCHEVPVWQTSPMGPFDAWPSGGGGFEHLEFAYDGGGLGKGGDVLLFLDGEKVGQGRVDATAAMVFSADDTCDVGMEGGAVVSEDYGARGNEFTGEVHWVQIDLADAAEDVDHLISPEERLRVAMAKQ